MRLHITMKPDRPLRLPLNYQQILQGFIYKSMQDRDFAAFLHESGYTLANRSFKLFTFGRLYGEFDIDKRNKMIIFKDQVRWSISSVLPKFIKELGKSILTEQNLHLNGQNINVGSIKYEDTEIMNPSCIIQMISPITIHSTYESSEGKKTTQYFDPDDPAFAHLITENLKRKYEAYYKRSMDGPFHIKPLRIHRRDKVITKFKDFIISGWNGTYKLSSTIENINFAYAVGIGGRNSQGFGMFNVME